MYIPHDILMFALLSAAKIPMSPVNDGNHIHNKRKQGPFYLCKEIWRCGRKIIPLFALSLFKFLDFINFTLLKSIHLHQSNYLKKMIFKVLKVNFLLSCFLKESGIFHSTTSDASVNTIKAELSLNVAFMLLRLHSWHSN
ncbi:hypothetical protein EGR_05562 [Echinococcus granulosus]|uniref:Uncharacterized protein n=1 Tax=Echinococcus granulosus TaxID=6210 RepID=W6UDU3_ECHGR|nr:hypothetical protein EGR_05562 [Echinococcus granulosus]EUB59535.1 hypothetical protein EGR_05562 [Echinococcus granulosus]